MARTKKEATNDVKVVEGKHVTVTHYPNGTATFNWDWKALELEILEATGSSKPAAVKKTAKKNLVKETETKVKKTRAKKTTS